MLPLPRCNPPQERNVPRRPGNVYGENRHPTDQLKDLEKQSRWEQNKERTRRNKSSATNEQRQDPGSSCNYQENLPGVSHDDPPSNNSIPIPGNVNQQSDVDLACLCR